LNYLRSDRKLRRELVLKTQPQWSGVCFPCGRTRENPFLILLRKEVIQPLLPERLPCYDLAPIANLALGGLRGGTDFGHCWLCWLDGQCVQETRTYSPQYSWPAITTDSPSCGRIAAHNPNWGEF